jgi:transaldolase
VTIFQQIYQAGTSLWFDFIRRDLLENGGLANLVEEGIKGVTSNPSIFQSAIAASTEYDDDIRRVVETTPEADANDLYETFAIQDIQVAADVLRPVYDETNGVDGYVSLEVNPLLAEKTDATVSEARRLWAAVDRPNLYIKVPATNEGVPAIEALIAEGINVNVTLVFSLQQYEAIARAYIAGLQKTAEPDKVSSVASFFVSRVDTATDEALESIGSDDALALRGRAGIANSKLAYEIYERLFGPEFAELARKGGRPQRLLWASTSTKNPNYRDVMYVEELVGGNTINTAPPHTLEAFRDHGVVRGETIRHDWDGAYDVFGGLETVGVDFAQITDQLLVEGVEKFASAFDGLMESLTEKRRQMSDG